MNFIWGPRTIVVDKNDVVKNEIFTYAFNNNTHKVIELINKYNININNFMDCYKNNLLHIASHKYNCELAKYLLHHKIYKDAHNILNLTPLDIAIRNQYKDMVSILVNNGNDINHLRNENNKLIEDIIINNETNRKLTESNDKLTTDYNGLYIQWQTDSKSQKRLRDDNDIFERENKKLRRENEILTHDNNTLKKTIENLRERKK
jgi:ankyrin repeat protein